LPSGGRPVGNEGVSVAIDPHKWLYAPREALVRDPQVLLDAFSCRPPYYQFDDAGDALVNFYDMGPQTPLGFRALKVWLGMRQAGKDGYVRMLTDDIALARRLHANVARCSHLEPWTQNLSITTFRYVPPDLVPGDEVTEGYLNQLNAALLTQLVERGDAYLSNAVVDGTFLLRACVVNFRTTEEDMDALPAIIVRLGQEIDAELRPVAGSVGEPATEVSAPTP